MKFPKDGVRNMPAIQLSSGDQVERGNKETNPTGKTHWME
tara:strand:- start:513 stop:632 length:120 start_codon:yes stop_codon:yes gene_type:complete